MSSENTLTGRNGKVQVASSTVSCVTSWDVNPTMDSSSEWGDSCSAGYTARAAGRRGATATVEGKLKTTDEVYDLFTPGDIAILTLWLDATSLYWDFPRALCSDFSLTVDVDTEEVIGWTSDWGNDGIFHRPGQAGAASRSL